MLQNKVPNVRFSKYLGIWKTTNLNRITEIIGGGTPDTKQSSYWNGGINWFSPTEVGKTVYLTKSEKTISQLGLQKSSAKLLPAFKTILFTSRAGIGDVGILTEESATNQGFQSLVVNGETDVYFLYSYSDQIKKYALKHSAGSTFLEISGKELGKMDLSIPSLPEQKAIGSLFRTLDDLLASYKDNLANYQSLKATMLSKMFPKAGQTVPEIRLDGFEDEWEKLKLRDIVHTNPKSELPENFKYIDLESVVGTRINKVREERKGSAPSRAQRLAKKGDVFYQTVRPYQKNNYLFKLDEIDYVFSTGYAQLRPIFKRCDSDFLLILLQNNRFLSKVLDRCTGTSYPAINVNDLIEILVAIPSYDEQRAIGSYFSNLDNLIATHQEKISQLETLKKKLLQDMFM